MRKFGLMAVLAMSLAVSGIAQAAGQSQFVDTTVHGEYDDNGRFEAGVEVGFTHDAGRTFGYVDSSTDGNISDVDVGVGHRVAINDAFGVTGTVEYTFTNIEQETYWVTNADGHKVYGEMLGDYTVSREDFDLTFIGGMGYSKGKVLTHSTYYGNIYGDDVQYIIGANLKTKMGLGFGYQATGHDVSADMDWTWGNMNLDSRYIDHEFRVDYTINNITPYVKANVIRYNDGLPTENVVTGGIELRF